jgi:hypothetical protein
MRACIASPQLPHGGSDRDGGRVIARIDELTTAVRPTDHSSWERDADFCTAFAGVTITENGSRPDDGRGSVGRRVYVHTGI